MTSNAAIPYEQAVFVSYAWGNESERMVDKVELAFSRHGIRIVRDKSDLEYKGSIEGFMQRIGRGACVIVVISDKYLRSPNCMFELIEIAENRDFIGRIFPIVLADANIYDPIRRIDYIRHWESRKSKLAKAMRTIDPANLHGIYDEINLYHRIRAYISRLASDLKDMNTLTPEIHENSGFLTLIDSVRQALQARPVDLPPTPTAEQAGRTGSRDPAHTPRSKERPSIFIGYSPRDKRIKDTLVSHLGVLQKVGKAELWINELAGKGQNSIQNAHQALEQANVAILLITRAFLETPWIEDPLVPELLNRRMAEGMIVLPLLAKDCNWQVVDWLGGLVNNFRPRNGRPVWSQHGRVDQLLTEVAREVTEVVQKMGGKKHEPARGNKPRQVMNLMSGIQLIRIPVGPFLMGSGVKERDALPDERPQHTLVLPDYYIARTPVTNAQYAEFIGNTAHPQPSHWIAGKPPFGADDHPVVNVSFHDAQAYCQWLSGVSGMPCRLPSEAEWEKAARGSDGRLYPWGPTWADGLCNTAELGRRRITSVYEFSSGRSPYGLLDMAGNTWEWTLSLWGEDERVPRYEYEYDPDDGREEVDAASSVRRVIRGGSYLYRCSHARAACRSSWSPDQSNLQLGFRIACSPTQ